MKRILLVTGIFPPMIGGPASFIDRLAHRLSEEDWSVTVVCTSTRKREAADRGRPFTVHRVARRNPYRYEVEIRLRLLADLLTHRRVLVNGLEPYVVPIARVLRRGYVLKVVGDHAWERARNLGETELDIDAFQVAEEMQSRFNDLVQRRNAAIRGSRLTIVPSGYLQRLVRGWVDDVPIEVIPNGVRRQEDAAEPIVDKKRSFRVLFVGRLTNWKGVETLLLALDRLEGVEARVVGDGPAFPLLKSLSAQLGLTDRVEFTGRLPKENVAEEYDWADALVLSSLYEGLSHTLLEAMSRGLPCVASRCGGNPELIEDGISGLLVPPQDPRATAHALVRLRDSRELRLRLGEGAREVASRHTFDTTVSRTIAAIERLWG